MPQDCLHSTLIVGKWTWKISSQGWFHTNRFLTAHCRFIATHPLPCCRSSRTVYCCTPRGVISCGTVCQEVFSPSLSTLPTWEISPSTTLSWVRHLFCKQISNNHINGKLSFDRLVFITARCRSSWCVAAVEYSQTNVNQGQCYKM